MKLDFDGEFGFKWDIGDKSIFEWATLTLPFVTATIIILIILLSLIK